MKKIFLILMVMTTLFSCGTDEIPIPASILVEETDLIFVGEGETYLNRVYSTEYPIEVEVLAEDQAWLSVSMKDKHLEIIAKRNESIKPRSTSFVVKNKERSISVKITQIGLPTRKLPIVSASGSSEETGEGPFVRSWDGDYASYWHSRYSSPSAQYSEHKIQYNLEPGSESLDMVIIYPRNNPGAANGRWGYYAIYVKGDGTDTPSEIPGNAINWKEELGSVDADGYKLVYKGDDTPYQTAFHVTTIELPVPIANPTSVKILIKGEAGEGGSRGGHCSLGEIEFYGKVN